MSRTKMKMPERAGLAVRLGFLAVLGGGLLLWAQLRKPRELQIELDLTRALPGEIVEVDLVVRRGSFALGRSDVRYGASGAPAVVLTLVHAAPGDAEVEATLIYAQKPARRTVTKVDLREGAPALVTAE